MTANSSERGRFARLAARGPLLWVLFEWARNPYVLVITVYVYATYFTRDIVGDPVRGQALWATIQGYSGLAVAVTAPFLGAIADAGRRSKPWIAVFAVLLAAWTERLTNMSASPGRYALCGSPFSACPSFRGLPIGRRSISP